MTGQPTPAVPGALMPTDFYQDRVLRSATGAGRVHIGRGTYYNTGTLFMAYTDSEEIFIGRYCSIADDVLVSSGGEHHTNLVSTYPFDSFFGAIGNPMSRSYRVRRNTSIGHDVWLGHGAMVLAGSDVGHGAIIGAGAVVSGSIPPYAIVVGNPGKVLRLRHSKQAIEGLLALAWWDWDVPDVQARRDDFYLPVDEFLSKYAAKL